MNRMLWAFYEIFTVESIYGNILMIQGHLQGQSQSQRFKSMFFSENKWKVLFFCVILTK